jgi:heme ABC exporter ATP-binding subunit CcmA
VSILVATGLTQRFGPELALDSIDLALDSGDHLAVLGENGAGKTTLLRILATAARPTSGQLEILGQDAFKSRGRLRRRIGYLAHAPGLYPALSALENLEFFCDLHGVDRSQAAECLESVGLAPVAKRPAGQLSRGMQQRVAIARTLLHDPRLLVLDEPDSSLGDDASELLGAVMKGRTVLLATHDRALAGKLCSRSLVLRRGRWAGTASRLRVVK